MLSARKIKEYLFKPGFHFSRIQFNLVGSFFLIIGFVVGTYVGLYNFFPKIFAINDTIHTWEFNEGTISDYVYDDSLIGIDNNGMYAGVNKISNGGFESNLDNWNWIENYLIRDDFSDTAPVVLASGGVSNPTPVLGTELFESDASTFAGTSRYSWTRYGTNTVSNSANELDISYVDNSEGAYNYLRGAFDLNSDMVISTWYTLSNDIKVNTGSVDERFYSGTSFEPPIRVSSTNFTRIDRSYRARSTTNVFINFAALESGETVTIDNLSVKPLTLSSLFSSIAITSYTDYIAQSNVTLTPGTQAGVVVNLDSDTNPSNFVIAYHDGENAKLEKNVNGTYTTLVSAAATYVAGAPIKVVRAGSSYTLFYNNVLVGTSQTISDASIINNTRFGVFSTYASNSFTNFEVKRGVNGTLATDGVNARVVKDSYGYASVNGGTFNLSGVAASIDPWFGYAGISRVAGRTLIMKKNSNSTSLFQGFAGSTYGAPSNRHGYSDGLNVYDHDTRIVTDNGTNPNQLAITLRSAGAYYFIKNNGVNQWKLMYGTSTGSEATLSPAFTPQSASPGTLSMDYFKLTSKPYLPMPIAYDTFTRVDGSSGSSETVGPDSQVTPQLTWDGGQIVGNKMVITPTLEANILGNGDMEGGFTSGRANGWSLESNPTLTEENVLKRNGNASQKVYSNTVANGIKREVSFVNGRWYLGEAYAYTTEAGVSMNFLTYDSSGFPYSTSFNISSGTWTRAFATGRSTRTSSVGNYFRMDVGPINKTAYFDDATLKPLTTSSLFSTVNTSTSDVFVDANIIRSSNTQAGIVMNLDNKDNPQNFVISYQDGGYVKTEKMVNGTYTVVQSTALSYVAGAQLRMMKDGTKYRVYYNNAQVGSDLTISDVSIINNTRHGLFSTYNANTFDNFSILPRGTNGEYNDIPAEDITVTRDTDIKYSGSSSAKLVSGGNHGNFVQSVNLGDTGAYRLSAYVYKDGGVVDSSDLDLYFNGSGISSTFESLGGGWYRVYGNLVGVNSSVEYGIRVKAGRTIYVDDLQLYKTGNYVLYTSTGYYNDTLTSWDNICDGEQGYVSCAAQSNVGGTSSIKYQLCTDDGAACESGNSWQFWNGSSWATSSNLTTDANTISELTHSVMTQLSPTNQKLSVKVIMTYDGINKPVLPRLSLGVSADVIAPDVNASNIEMKLNTNGPTVPYEGWANDIAPKFTWTAGSDNTGGSGMKGYCVYIGQDENGDPATSKGILGDSPVDLETSDCQFIIATNSIDFSDSDLRGNTWLTSSTLPYYINLKSIDLGNNSYEGASASFKFYFDNEKPTNVSFTSCSSGSFSNVVDMTFAWPTTGGISSSDSHSNILGWQYQINSTTEQWKGTSTNSTLGLNYIPIGQSSYTLGVGDESSIVSGNNVVYFRTVDNAGNPSLDSTVRTCNLSYGGAAPTFGGTDVVTISPSTSGENNYALSWPSATPAGETQVAKYFYMVNTTPPSTLLTLQNNPSTYIDNGINREVSIGSLPNVNKGVNTVYVVSVDNASTPNYSPSNYISGTFTLDSTDPDNVRDLVISDSSIKLQSRWNVTLSWVEPEYKGAGNLSYDVYRSTNGIEYAKVGSSSGLSYVDNTPSSTMYHYKVYTKDGANALSSGTNSLSITPTGKWTQAPVLESGPTVDNITTQRANIKWSTTRGSDSKIQFGTQSGKYGDVEPSTSDQVTSHNMQLGGLRPETTYYYRAKWTDEDGNTGISEEKTFTTAPAPSIKQVLTKNIGLSSAIIQFTSKGASGVKIYYGKTTNFGGIKEVSTSTSETRYTVDLSDLDDGTKYYYRINTLDIDGTEYTNQVNEFSTLPRPRLSNVRLQQVSGTAQTTILVTWNSNTEVSSIVTYWPEGKNSQARDEVSIELKKGEHRIILRGLVPSTAYNLEVKGRDKVGNEAKSDIQRFSTATDTRAPLITDLRVEGSTVPPFATTAQESSVQLIVSWTTDEPATSQVEFAEGTGTIYTQKTQKDSNLAYNHVVVISNLVPSKVYHLRAISDDSIGNSGYSVDVVTIAPKVTDNALNLVIQNLTETFNFLTR